MNANLNTQLSALLQHPSIRRGGEFARADDTIPTGFPELDRELPGGGWPQGMLTELLIEQPGSGELRLLLPALARLTHAGQWVGVIAPPYLPYAPALAAAGVDLSRFLWIDTEGAKKKAWAAEQALHSGSCAAVLFWPASGDDDRHVRRLQLAAEAGKSAGFLFQPTARAMRASPAALRLEVAPTAEGLRVRILKRRGALLGRPLLLPWHAVPRSSPLPLPQREATVVASHRVVSARSNPRLTPRYTKAYANGGGPRSIWNRAIVRADEVRRGTVVDPR